MSDTPDVLRRIVARKREEVAARKQSMPLDKLRAAAATQSPPRSFARALTAKRAAGESAVIAEIKRASPSKGVIRDHFDPPSIAQSYERAGAACLSVLTDADFFQGSEQALIDARAAVTLPVLRKDFMVDRYQIIESRAIGADCVLLIVAILSDEEINLFHGEARALGMDVLIEVHTEGELRRVRDFKDALIGINNRDLHTFSTTLETTFKLLPLLADGRQVVTESGINTRADIDAMRTHGVDSFLVGEAFMRATDPGRALVELFGVGTQSRSGDRSYSG